VTWRGEFQRNSLENESDTKAAHNEGKQSGVKIMSGVEGEADTKPGSNT